MTVNGTPARGLAEALTGTAVHAESVRAAKARADIVESRANLARLVGGFVALLILFAVVAGILGLILLARVVF